MNVNLTPNITGKNVNIIKGATQADLTNSVNNSKIYRDEAEAFSIVSEAKSIEASYSALNASISSTTISDKATIATTKANEANNSANSASASEAVCIAKATITTDKANIATAQSVIATDKANEASVSANAAATQAGIATTKASEASTSASNALTSSNNADTSEANALTYRNQAEAFANSINTGDIVHISGTETITGNKTFSGTVSGLTKATVGLNNVDNTSDANKPISNAVQTALDLKADKATTIGGYGITDAYTKTSTDSLIDIHSKTEKTTLVDADEFMPADSTSTFSLKKITWASIKTALTSSFTPRVAITTNKAIARYSNTTGDLQNSAITIDDNGNIGSGTQSFNGFGGSGFKNLIINGNFNVWQRGTSFSAVGYCADRWHLAVGGSANVMKHNTSPNTISSTTTAASSFANLYQAIETATVIGLRGKTLTLSLKLQTGGTHTGGFVITARYSNSTDTLTSQTTTIQSLGISANSTNTRYSLTFTVPVDAVGLRIDIENNAVQPSGALYQVQEVQLEEGSIATPFENRPYGLELGLCQRYYRKNQTLEGFFRNSTEFICANPYYTEMRVPPTVSIISGVNSIHDPIGVTFRSFTGMNTSGAYLNLTGTSVSGINNGGQLMSGYLSFSAEL